MKSRTAEAIQLLVAEVNGNRDVGAEICTALMAEHRTLQASFWRGIMDAMKVYGTMATCDARNKGAVDACLKITEFAGNPENEVYIPYI